MQAQAQAVELPRKLGLVDGVAIIVGTMIGSGIFLVPNLVARNVSTPGAIIGVWVFSGVLSFFGALAYAELGAMFPATGGQYVYLREAYGSLLAFLSGWTLFFTALTAAVGWLSINFTNYLRQFISFGPGTAKVVAVGLIACLTYANYRGVTAGAAVQKTLTALKLLGLAILIFGAFFGRAPAAVQPAGGGFSVSHFGVAMIAALLSYDGWVALTYVAGEVRNPKRNLVLALGLGMAVVMAVYILANIAYLRVLTIPEIAGAERVGGLTAERALGSAGATIVSLTILLSIAGASNGWLLTAPRMYFAQARDGLFLRSFRAIHPRYQTPYVAVIVFGAWSAALAVSGTYEALASLAMFSVWIFYGFTAAGVLVLRRKDPDRPRPFPMWGYPVTLILFLLVALAFVLNTMISTPGPALVSMAIIACGVPVYYFWKRT